MTFDFKEANHFIKQNDLQQLYKSYKWRNDQWSSGFSDIAALEQIFKMERKKHYVSRNAVLRVVDWGKLRNPRVTCPDRIEFIHDELSEPRRIYPRLYVNISGLGPTYLSKLIRFMCPETAGAIDTRIVRVFGSGDSSVSKSKLIDLKVSNNGYGWYINKNQTKWPNEYFVWLQTLSKLRDVLNDNHISCPHPDNFVDLSLREEGKWTNADVEMALFAYCSGIVAGDSHN